MIAVTGATGKLGQHIISELVKKVPAQTVIAIVRNLEKGSQLKKYGVQLREANYDQPASLEKSLVGVSKLLLISSNEIGKRFSQHKAVIDAAKKNHVQHLIYTSILRANSSSLSLAKEHLQTEEYIQSTQLNYTFLRNGWYLENHTENLAGALAHGAMIGSAGNGKFSSASRLDYALAAVTVLTSPGHDKKIYELAGSHSFTMNQLAAEVSQQSGKTITYQNLPFADFEKALLGFDLPAPFAHLLADSDVGASKGELESSSQDLAKLIGRESTSLQVAVKAALR